jgi:tetratricopeptide (TPR) repeat protein
VQYERCAGLASELGDRATAAGALAAQGAALLGLGAIDESQALLERSLAQAREAGDRTAEGDALHALAECANALGSEESAERLQREALAVRRGAGLRDGAAASLVALGRLLARTGRDDEARAVLDEAAVAARDADAPGAAVVAACSLSLLPGGDAAAAVEAFDREAPRLALAQRVEARYLLFRATGDRAHLVDARNSLERLRANAPEQRRETVLTHVRLHREILTAVAAEGTE